MINIIYRLVAPKLFEETFQEIDTTQGVIVRPLYLSICKADQRYYQGKRSTEVLEKKLPMALIHEGVGVVVKDNTNTFNVGDNVAMIPNTPVEEDKYIKSNYLRSSKFRGSGFDGFTSDLVVMDKDLLVKLPDDFDLKVSSFIELISVSYGGIERFKEIKTTSVESLGVWGDGAVGFLTSILLKKIFPDSKVIVFGKHIENLEMFSFVDEVYKINNVPADVVVNHAFECVGSQASQSAISQIIDLINPQGIITLFGVSEYPIPINTRMVLEKGLTLQGISRSTREEFVGVVDILEKNPEIFEYLDDLINEVIDIKNIDDLKEAFDKDSISNFGKTVMKWDK